MRYRSAPVAPEERQETTRERAARQRRERQEELRYTESDEKRWAENRERVLRDRECAGIEKRSIGFLHIGTRSAHKFTVNMVAEFDQDGTLKPKSEEALRLLIEKNKDYVIGFSGHSIPMKSGKANKYTYTKEVNGKMAGKVDTAGAMKSISDCLKAKGSNIVGLIDGHCYSKKRSLPTMLKGLEQELDASRIHCTTKKTTCEETRLAGLTMMNKLNKENSN